MIPAVAAMLLPSCLLLRPRLSSRLSLLVFVAGGGASTPGLADSTSSPCLDKVVGWLTIVRSNVDGSMPSINTVHGLPAKASSPWSAQSRIHFLVVAYFVC